MFWTAGKDGGVGQPIGGQGGHAAAGGAYGVWGPSLGVARILSGTKKNSEEGHLRELLLIIYVQVSNVGHPFLVKILRPCGKLIGMDANLVELRCAQYKGSTNCPGRDSLNTVSSRMEEFIGYL